MIDIYFEYDYGRLYENIENGKCEVFEYKRPYGIVRHMFIKRLITIEVGGKTYYDLVTPYGYGGPIIVKCEDVDEAELIYEFEKSFREYCIENNIVSEFVRFHPVIGNAELFKGVYDVDYVRNTLGTNLQDYKNPIESEFSKSCRKEIRRALKSGVRYEIIKNPYEIYDFQKIYYSTMKRNQAAEYYYFNDEYFEQCVEWFGKNIVLVKAIYNEITIAMGFYFVYDKIIHMHLSGTLSEFMHLSPAYILKYAITLWGKENGYSLIHHGGGKSNDENDSLFLFKKKFCNNTQFKFYTGKKIWNEDVYNKLCKLSKADSKSSFFPLYRMRK